MRIMLRRQGRLLAASVRECRSFISRLRGWRAYASASDVDGVYLSPCCMVHTWGMRFAIDAVHVDAAGKVIRILTLVPGALGSWIQTSVGVLEVRAGLCQQMDCRAGDYLDRLDGEEW